MKNISFDNPYWLFLAIPLFLALLIPYFISVSKDNKNKGWITSLIIHITIVIALTLSAAGLVHTTVITRTKVYVVADVSYSSHRNFDTIDEYIQNIDDNLPQNSRLGIVCFGNDCQILTSSGTKIKSVKEANVDDSGTNIANALDYTSTLFSANELKRIILITDGADTVSNNGQLVSAVERLMAKNIRLDALYLDNRLQDGEAEMQVFAVDHTQATYLHHETQAKVSFQSSVENDAIIDLYVKAEDEDAYKKIDTKVVHADIGVSATSFTLPTDVSGTFDYKVEITATKDTSPHNNTYHFTQTVAGKRNVLLVTEVLQDYFALTALYGQDADIQAYVINDANKDVPYTVEELSQYDEIILSNLDIRKVNNANAFVDSIDVVVAQYGKSLITMGDLAMQNKDDPLFDKLDELLPVRFGNANRDAKLYTIVLDISRSMHDSSQLIVAKDASIKLLSLLDDNDHVALVTLAGAAKVEQIPTRLGDCRQELNQKIQNALPTQGTFIGEALKMAHNHIKDLPFAEKQVMLISDGLTFTYEPEDAVTVAQDMFNDDITVSTVNVLNANDQDANTLLSGVAQAGGGEYYVLERAEQVAELVFASIADDLTESIVEKQTDVTIERFRDDVVDGIATLPHIYGYVNSKPKADANMVLSVGYQKNASTTVQVPLYSYRSHVNGKVASFTSSLSGDWLSDWTNDVKEAFFGNVLTTNTPKERIHYPYALEFTNVGSNSSVEIVPSYLNPRASASIKVTAPDGSVEEKQMSFSLNCYFANFQTLTTGRYSVEISYTYGSHTFTSQTYLTVPYYPEYDAFAVYDVASVHQFIRGNGQVSTDGTVDLTNDKNDIATYELSFQLPLLIVAITLFVVDVFIRKTRWKDVKAFFTKKKKGGQNK